MKLNVTQCASLARMIWKAHNKDREKQIEAIKESEEYKVAGKLTEGEEDIINIAFKKAEEANALLAELGIYSPHRWKSDTTPYFDASSDVCEKAKTSFLNNRQAQYLLENTTLPLINESEIKTQLIVESIGSDEISDVKSFIESFRQKLYAS